MSTILPGSPPAFNRNDMEGTVRALCVYSRNMHDTLDYMLGQFKRDVSEMKAAAEEQGKAVANLQIGLVSGIQLMNEQYNSLSARIAAIEEKLK